MKLSIRCQLGINLWKGMFDFIKPARLSAGFSGAVCILPSFVVLIMKLNYFKILLFVMCRNHDSFFVLR